MALGQTHPDSTNEIPKSTKETRYQQGNERTALMTQTQRGRPERMDPGKPPPPPDDIW